MKVLGIVLAMFATSAFGSTCEKIEELGFPITGKCTVTDPGQIANVKSEMEIVSADVCWGSFGSAEDGQHAVAVSMESIDGETIDYLWDMPTGRANRTSVNSYTYFGKWKKGVFFEDQDTFKEEGKRLKSFRRQGVVINYRDKEVELVHTTKPYWGKQRTQIDAYLKCGTMK